MHWEEFSNAKGYAAGYVKENNTLENDVDISYDILETNIELKEDDYALIFGVNANRMWSFQRCHYKRSSIVIILERK